jgi:hypothetical protein
MTTNLPNVEPELTPAGILMNLIIVLLAPMFLGPSGGDIAYARLAAKETVNAYCARNQADLIAVAQIVAFGLAALGSLSLSLADDIPLSMILRLRGNAVALNRSAEQNRRASRDARANGPELDPAAFEADMWLAPHTPATVIAETDTIPETAESAETSEFPTYPQHATDAPCGPATPLLPVPPTATGSAEKRHQAMWAIAMVKEAGEISASIAGLPLIERHTASMRAAALTSCANSLLYRTGQPGVAPTQ